MAEKATTGRATRARTKTTTTKKTTSAKKTTRKTQATKAKEAVAASLAELDTATSATRKKTAKKARAAHEAQGTLDGIAESASKARSATAGASTQVPFSGVDGAHEPMQAAPLTTLLFQEPEEPVRPRLAPASSNNTEAEGASDLAGEEESAPRRRRRGSRGRRKQSEGEVAEAQSAQESTPEAKAGAKDSESASAGTSKATPAREVQAGTVRRRTRKRERTQEPEALTGSTRLEAKRQRRQEGREAGRRRHTITESEYLARRESVRREMLIREQDGLNQIAVLEDDVLVEHYVARHTQVSMVGNVYLGRVQNVLPSMEAAFVDIGKGRNAVLYAGEVNWEAAGMEGKPRRIEQALTSGDTVLVQVTKDPIGHKGARLTAQITLAGRHLVLVPSGAMTGISRKLPDKERTRLKRLLRDIVPAGHGVIVRTAAEGASEEQLRADVERLMATWEDIEQKAAKTKSAPVLLKGEPELAVRVVRDIFNEDFASLRIQGEGAYATIREYVAELSPELESRVEKWAKASDIFAEHRVDEQLAKAFDRKVWLPSGGTLVIDRTEAMTVIDVNTGKFTGTGGTLEETVTRNNLEAAEEIVRQLRLRDIGGIIVVDFIDMVLESNRELVLRRLVECLGRDRTRHQVAEVTSLGLVQMTRKRVGQGLVEAFSTTCESCEGRGYHIHTNPVEHSGTNDGDKRQVRREKKATKVAAVKEDAQTKAAMKSIAAARKASKGDEERAEEAAVASVEESKPARTRRTRTSASRQASDSAKAGTASETAAPRTKASTAAKPRRTHAAASTGTVTPSSAQGAILSFPSGQ